MSTPQTTAPRAHALLSASSAYRWLACPPSAVAAEAYPPQDSAFTREGTLAHAIAAQIAQMPPAAPFDLAAHPGVDQTMVDCACGYRDYIHEQLHGAGAVVLIEQRVDFSRWVPGGFGTCDCLIIQGDTLTIMDYKYGQGVPVSAVGNPQMQLYALGALHDFGFAFDVARIEMHIYQPRLDNISTDTLSVTDLLAWADGVVAPRAAKAALGKGDYTPGEHCRFCPHAGRCRALADVCTAYVDTHQVHAAVPILAPHEVADILSRAPLILLWLRRVKGQAMADMRNGRPVPGWKVVEGQQGDRKWVDERQVAAALRAAGYADADFTAVKLLSPAGMEKTIGKKQTAQLLSALITRTPGAPTIVPETDNRPAYDRAAEALRDFE